MEDEAYLTLADQIGGVREYECPEPSKTRVSVAPAYILVGSMLT
jgi:hypothetical protein